MKIDLSFPAKKYKCWAAKKKDTDVMGTPYSRDWTLDDWKLPQNWKEIFIKKMDELRKKYRSFQLYLDICVRCGACADKCHFFIDTLDPRNMPVARAEILRSIYRKYYTIGGKLFGKLAGAQELTEEVLKDLLYPYFYQCAECRRCALYCPYGIDTAEITWAARELLTSVGVQTKYVTEVIAKVYTIGNNLGIPPKAFAKTIELAEEEMRDEIKEDAKIPFNKKGAEVMLVTPSAEFFSPYHWGTMIGWAKMFHQIGLDYTTSTYASEGGFF
ncbi:MAG: (Fe-S)-binding protein, partial [Euryarchaeota archaeon]|nr:(Fe-S)-binding protein [Euryarchaeota archaeon]